MYVCNVGVVAVILVCTIFVRSFVLFCVPPLILSFAPLCGLHVLHVPHAASLYVPSDCTPSVQRGTMLAGCRAWYMELPDKKTKTNQWVLMLT